MDGFAGKRSAVRKGASDIPLTGSLLDRRLLYPVYCAVRYDVRLRLFHAAETLQEV